VDLTELDRLSREAAREELPALLGRLTELEARVRLRLAEVPASPALASRTIDADEATRIAGTSKRWLLAKTRGMGLRRDLSRKQPRFDEAALRAWLAGRRR
jgi:hypothetical protein